MFALLRGWLGAGAVIVLMAVASVEDGHAGVPLIDDQPAAQDSCPVSVIASTETDSGGVGVRQYGCMVEGANVVYTVAIPPGCEQGGCGMIFDNHGATMSAASENAGTQLREYGWHATDRGAPTPFIVVQPNLTDLFDSELILDWASVTGGAYQNELPNILYMVNHLASVFQVDTQRMHMYGFSRGAATTSAIYCDAGTRNLFASYAVGGGGINCALDAPLMIINGIGDPGKMDLNNALEDSVKATSGYAKTVIVKDPNWSSPTWDWTWTGVYRKGRHRHIRLQAGDLLLESIKHSGSTFPALGHCHPVDEHNGWLTCYANMETGTKLVDFFIQNPRQN